MTLGFMRSMLVRIYYSLANLVKQEVGRDILWLVGILEWTTWEFRFGKDCPSQSQLTAARPSSTPDLGCVILISLDVPHIETQWVLNFRLVGGK